MVFPLVCGPARPTLAVGLKTAKSQNSRAKVLYLLSFVGVYLIASLWFALVGTLGGKALVPLETLLSKQKAHSCLGTLKHTINFFPGKKGMGKRQFGQLGH